MSGRSRRGEARLRNIRGSGALAAARSEFVPAALVYGASSVSARRSRRPALVRRCARILLTLLLLVTLGVAVEDVSAGGYVTPLFARGNYSGVAPGHVSMDSVKPFLDARNIDASVTVVTSWPYEHERRIKYSDQIYLSWDDLASLQAEGWTIASHGRTGVATSGSAPATANAEVNGSLTDLLTRGFTRAWSLFAYKGSSADAFTEKLVRDSYAYGRGNTASNKTLPLERPERARTMTTLGGPCSDSTLSCYRSGTRPYYPPSHFISSINAMTAEQWTIVQSYRFVEGTDLEGTLAFDCTGPVTQHWTRDAAGGRELYCWNDYQAIIDGLSTTFESPHAIAERYGRAIFTGIAPRAGVSPETLSFGKVAKGTTSSFMKVTFLNTGTAALTVSFYSLMGANPLDFAVRVDVCNGIKI